MSVHVIHFETRLIYLCSDKTWKNKKNLLEEEQSGIIAETLMNISEKGEKLIHSTNVYNSCNGDYRRGQRINREYIAASKDHELIKQKEV